MKSSAIRKGLKFGDSNKSSLLNMWDYVIVAIIICGVVVIFRMLRIVRDILSGENSSDRDSDENIDDSASIQNLRQLRAMVGHPMHCQCRLNCSLNWVASKNVVL